MFLHSAAEQSAFEFHTRRGIESKRGHGRQDANGAVIRWASELGIAISEANGLLRAAPANQLEPQAPRASFVDRLAVL